MKKTKDLLLPVLLTGIFVLCTITSDKAFGQDLPVKARVYLQGAWNGSPGMNTTLGRANCFPLSQPYTIAPFYYPGLEAVSSVPDSVVDWVLLELRRSSDTAVNRRAALLLSNGHIVDTNLSREIVFEYAVAGDYYLVIKHRNHLPVMTSLPISLPNSVSYDFTDTINFPPYGGASKALFELGSGIFGIIAGDVNQNCEIRYSGPDNDRALILQRIVNETGSTNITNVLRGYYSEDVTMDSLVKYSGPGNDPSRIIQNIVLATGSIAITGVFDCNVPVAEDEVPFKCGHLLIDQRDDRQYQTILIGAQCWMAENLNAGNRINASQGQINNGTIEKYCYNDQETACDSFGGFYNWDEAMAYSSAAAAQGICPEGWHMPEDWEYKVLEANVDSMYDINSPVWNNSGDRGYDAGKNLKSSYGWSNNGNGTDAFGFVALAAGVSNSGIFSGKMDNTSYWTSTEFDGANAWLRKLENSLDGVNRSDKSKDIAYSIRCVIDSLVCLDAPTPAEAGQDQLGLQTDSTWLDGNIPQRGNGEWVIIDGNGGILQDSLDPNTLFSGVFGVEYTLLWTITTYCGISIDTVKIYFDSPPTLCPDSIIDTRDAKVYKIAHIGEQCWMAINLDIGSAVNYVNGQSDNGVIEKYCYNDDTANCAIYGGLYRWDELMDYTYIEGSQGICPDGWHIPTDEEWKILEGFVDHQFDVGDSIWDDDGYRGNDAGFNLKADTLWANDANGRNQYKFAALPGGSYISGYGFRELGATAYLWTSSGIYLYPNFRSINYQHKSIFRVIETSGRPKSARCLRNITAPCSPGPDTADAGPDQLNIPAVRTSLQGNIHEIGQMVWRVISGQGGVLRDSLHPFTSFTGLENTTYELTWTISNLCGSSSDTVIISFGTIDAACGDSITDVRDGQQYGTVQIGEQCWMTENLDLGSRIDHPQDQEYNNTIEKYCHGNDSINCEIYGGLYQWNEMMHYSKIVGDIGICPPGWHVPGNEEWKVLEGFVDKQYDIGDPLWNNVGYRGSDVARNLKSDSLWPNTYNGSNLFGFNALPGAAINMTLGHSAYFWTSLYYKPNHYTDHALTRDIAYSDGTRLTSWKLDNTFSLRCMKDTVTGCFPGPDPADAGPDQLNIPAIRTSLHSNLPVIGRSFWHILSGNGGIITDSLHAFSVFTGPENSFHILVWTTYNHCDTTHDTVNISFGTIDASCGDSIIDDRDGQKYGTVQIGEQCWMSQNMNLGEMKSLADKQILNFDYEKYCYDGDSTRCDTFGGLYNWDEMMLYSVLEGDIGICLPGWHVPTDYEWKILEGFVDEVFDIGDPVWDNTGFRGSDAGKNLKSDSLWTVYSGIDLYGFNGLPGGYVHYNSAYYGLNDESYLWTSTPLIYSQSYYRQLSNRNTSYGGYFDYTDINRHIRTRDFHKSVRCLKDTVSGCLPGPEQADAGPDQLNIPATRTSLSANNPLIGRGRWSIFSGSGGVITDTTNPVSSFSGIENTTYTLTWTTYNHCGTISDNVIISFGSIDATCDSILYDVRDSRTYQTIQIGPQCWMAENLDYGKMTSTPQTAIDRITDKLCYDNDSANCIVYGGLYSWNEMMNHSVMEGDIGICPTGWHIPSDNDWKMLEGFADSQYGVGDPVWDADGYRGKDAGTRLKSDTLWSNINGNNIFGFMGIPGGYGYYSSGSSSYNYKGNVGYFWTSRKNGSNTTFRGLSGVSTLNQPEAYAMIGRLSRNVETPYFYSVRCVKDSVIGCSPGPNQANAGPDQLNVPAIRTKLQADSPVIGNGVWSIISGQGGMISDSANPTTYFRGLEYSTYTLQWIVENYCGSRVDTVSISFTTDTVCGTSLTDSRDGKTYLIAHIGDQCWMAENLNLGLMVSDTATPTNNGIYEKHCYNHDSNNCVIYGGLYSWDEMMDYTSQEGAQGICPSGWHVPTDAEWKTLEGNVDSQYGVGSGIWDNGSWRGFDAGKNLKSTTLWESSGNGDDIYGFTGLPGGFHYPNSHYSEKGDYSYFWTSSIYGNSAYVRLLGHYTDKVRRNIEGKGYGIPVRCLMD